MQKTVAYWMIRDHRVDNNRGLSIAQDLALQNKSPLVVFSAFRKDLSKANMADRTFSFLLDGLEEVEESLKEKDIQYLFLQGDVLDSIEQFVEEYKVGLIVTDFFPLKVYMDWQKQVEQFTKVMVVDSHNIVPCWEVSDKQEYAARTFRPKIWRAVKKHFAKTPKIKKHPYVLKKKVPKNNWNHILNETKTVTGFDPVSFKSGEKQAKKALHSFIEKRLTGYAEKRNDPSDEGTSLLSPYIHFGQISAEEIYLKVQEVKAPEKDKEAFLEECIVRRELSDNFYFYQKGELSLKSAPEWAQNTLKDHTDDPREYMYSYDEFLNAKTHDEAWNAAQNQLLKTGHMHGYMRMYWCKKILEWTESPQEAFEIAVKLNDLLELDGRDPNGYVGILWSIAGVHDRGWTERPIFGKIRYMNFNGLKRKFNIDTYIQKWT